MTDARDLKKLSDDELLRRLSVLMGDTRRGEVELVAHIGEVDARRLYAREAAPSMFEYCRRVLKLRENEAYLRIAVARATREHPTLLPMLEDGRLHLSGVAKLARHLTVQNRDSVLARAAGMSHRQIKELVAELEPRPDVPSRIRKLREPVARSLSAPSPQLGTYRVGASHEEDARPEVGAPRSEPPVTRAVRRPEEPPAHPLHIEPPRATVEPLSPARHRVQFTASAELREKLERLQALMRSTVPDGDLATVVEIAVTEKLARLEARRFGQTKQPRKSLAEADPRPASRTVPAPVRRVVHERDDGRCTYETPDGRRCTERVRLEYHHEDPFGHGGGHEVDNVRLLCRAHNLLLAERDYGKERMAIHRRSGRVAGASPHDASPPASTRVGHGPHHPAYGVRTFAG